MEAANFARLKEILEGVKQKVKVNKTDHPSGDYIQIVVGDKDTTGDIVLTIPMEQLDAQVRGGEDWLEML